MCTLNMTFEIPDAKAIDVDALKSQLNDFFKVIVSRPSILKENSIRKHTLRNAFSGNWGDGMDAVSYAQMLREESVVNNREDLQW